MNYSQAPLSFAFLREKYWSGLPFPFPEDLPNPEVELMSPGLHLAGGFLPLRHLESLLLCCSFAQSCLTLCDSMDCSMPGFPVLHHVLEFAQTQVHWVDDAIQPSHLLLSPSPAFKLSQHQGLFKWFSTSYQVAKILELQHQSFQWIFSVDFF